MGWLEWKHDLDEANKAYDEGRIGREIYETRVKMAIYMINKCGESDIAEKIAKAHGYNFEKLIKEQNEL